MGGWLSCLTGRGGSVEGLRPEGTTGLAPPASRGSEEARPASGPDLLPLGPGALFREGKGPRERACCALCTDALGDVMGPGVQWQARTGAPCARRPGARGHSVWTGRPWACEGRAVQSLLGGLGDPRALCK